ncbi:hypothetical protein HBB16_06315 [Pseudonocardia sp. MCCB 268]|nr:hypothetical protein [Pseudonocardia cytotoxica]
MRRLFEDRTLEARTDIGGSPALHHPTASTAEFPVWQLRGLRRSGSAIFGHPLHLSCSTASYEDWSTPRTVPTYPRRAAADEHRHLRALWQAGDPYPLIAGHHPAGRPRVY